MIFSQERHRVSISCIASRSAVWRAHSFRFLYTRARAVLTTRRSRPQPSATIVSKVAPSGAREWAALDAERLITLAPRDAAAPAPPAGANDKHLIFSTVNGYHRVNTDRYLDIAK